MTQNKKLDFRSFVIAYAKESQPILLNEPEDSYEVNENINQFPHSESIIAEDQECGELEDKLFENALKNLDHFPQLLDEVLRLKQEKEMRMKAEAEKRKEEEMKAILLKKQAELEEAKELEKRKNQQLMDAQKVIKDHEEDEIKKNIIKVRLETDWLREFCDRISAELSFSQRQCETLQKLKRDAENHQSKAAQYTSLEDFLGIQIEKIVTPSGQAHISQLKMQRLALDTQVNEINACICQRKQLIDTLKHQKHQHKDENRTYKETIKSELEKSIASLMEQKESLTRQLNQ